MIALIMILGGIIHFDFNKKVRMNFNLFYIIIFYLITISTFAYRMGDDGITYETQFLSYISLFDADFSYILNHDYRPGWVFLSTLCKTISSSYILFKLVYASFVNLVMAQFLRRYFSYPYLGLLFYFIMLYFDFNFGILRQSFSIAIFIYSIKYLINSNLKKYFACCIIATLFHESALITIVLPFLKNIRLEGKTYVMVIIGLLLIVLFASDLSQLFLSIAFSPDSPLGRLELYKNPDAETTFGTINIILNICIPILLLSKISERVNIGHYEVFMLFYLIIYIFSGILPIGYRLLIYFVPFYILFWVETIVYITGSMRFSILLKNIMCLLFCLLFLFSKKRLWFFNVDGTRIPQYTYIYPYTSIFSQEKIIEREELFRRDGNG